MPRSTAYPKLGRRGVQPAKTANAEPHRNRVRFLKLAELQQILERNQIGLLDAASTSDDDGLPPPARFGT
jgi:hypothetical protein